MIRRRADWQKQLAEYVETERAARRQYVYGRSDCLSLALGALRVMTGGDVEFCPPGAWYETRRGGARLIRRLGHKSFSEMFAAFCTRNGMIEIPPAFAMPGDLVEMPSGVKDIDICVCVAWRGCALTMLGEGRGLTPVSGPFSRAWRVT